LPTGTYTFLFTDIEGSTTLWEQRPAEMRPALEAHDRILRRAIESSFGRVVKTTGDGMLAVFGDAKDALSASLAAQRALHAVRPGFASGEVPDDQAPPITLKVRMGLHTGVADVRDDDYFGSSVNRAARIMSVAQGQQILLSAATAELVSDALPDGVALRDLGEHRLKGLLNLERLLQIVASGLRTEFPPLETQTAHSLPAERDTFVGRSDALADLDRRFAAGARLVSVFGPGGAGKTRLVTRFGWSALAGFAGGVWFCDLAQAQGIDGIVQAVAQGLQVPLGKDDPVVQVANAIAGRGRCIVILDNFEQVARHAEQTLGHWLSRARDARFLVTTREVLGLPGEEVLALAPLAPEDASELFLRRAEAAKPGFAPTAEDTAAIAPLVRLLDGLPLAIELAAARVRVMPPRTLLVRMKERFKLLSTMGGRVVRQATLRAVFDWSWDLLSLPERAALAQLSVFEGGFALEAVEAVLDLSPYADAPWPMDALQSLVQKSLVRPVADARFDLLVSVKEYAAEHLGTELRYEGSGAAARLEAEARHGSYFARLEERAATANGCVELDNLVAACRRAVARGDAETAARALELAWQGLKLRGPFRTAVELASIVDRIEPARAVVAARVNVVAGEALQYCGKISDAKGRLEAALESARAVGDRTCECRALAQLGPLALQEGSVDAMRACLEAARAHADTLGERKLQGNTHNGLGQLNAIIGRPGEAREHYEQALLLAREARDRRLEGAVLANLAILYGSTGLPDKARSHAEAALVLARELGDRRVESNTLCNLGLLQFGEGRLAEAEDSLQSALIMARDMGHAHLEVVVLCNLGMVHERANDLAAAQSDLENALTTARELGLKRPEGQVLGYLGLVHARRAAFAEARRCLDAGEALLRTVSDLESLGILLAIRAEAQQLDGCADAARAALDAAEVVAIEVAPGPGSEFGNALMRARRSLAQWEPAA
jgi:predicted ATPase/class 3 adenylate cyclase/Tfp pilus assembly protein PilF